MKTVFKSNKNIVYSCHYHIIWCSKYRRQVLNGDIQLRLKQILQQISNETRCEILEMEVLPDHLHLLVSSDPQFGIHRTIKRMKGTSSRLLRQEFPFLKTRLPTLWTNSYFLATAGGAPLALIKRYIENQKNV
jgi:putative transposase